MSVLELNQYVQEQIVDNPFLELEYPEAIWNKDAVNSKTFSREVDHDWWLNSSHFTEKSLEQILREQLEWMHLDKKTFDLCSFIIGNLDDRGYLEITKELLAQYKQITLEKIKEALQIVQSLEPSGIAASSLEECLLIQLDHQKEQNELVRKLVSHDLQDIAKGKMVQLAKRYQVEVADIRQIGDLDYALQGKLLRVLQENEFRRVGGNEMIRTNARVVTATKISRHYEKEKRIFVHS